MKRKKNSGKIRRVGIGGNPLQNECRYGTDSKKIYEKLSPILKISTRCFHRRLKDNLYIWSSYFI